MYFLAGQATNCVYVCTLVTEPRGNMHAGLLAAAERSRQLFKIVSKLNRMCLLPSNWFGISNYYCWGGGICNRKGTSGRQEEERGIV